MIERYENIECLLDYAEDGTPLNKFFIEISLAGSDLWKISEYSEDIKNALLDTGESYFIDDAPIEKEKETYYWFFSFRYLGKMSEKEIEELIMNEIKGAVIGLVEGAIKIVDLNVADVVIEFLDRS